MGPKVHSIWLARVIDIGLLILLCAHSLMLQNGYPSSPLCFQCRRCNNDRKRLKLQPEIEGDVLRDSGARVDIKERESKRKEERERKTKENHLDPKHRQNTS